MATLAALAAVAWMGLIFALSSRGTIPEPFGLGAELVAIGGHLTAYAVLAILLWWAIAPLEFSASRRVALALSGAVIYGLSDEWHQSFDPGSTPGRARARCVGVRPRDRCYRRLPRAWCRTHRVAVALNLREGLGEMEQRIAAWADQYLGAGSDEIVPVAAGLGDTDLWRVRRAGGAGDLLVRRFAAGADAMARRELLAMRAARTGGVPVPEVLAFDVLDERPVLVTAWCDGVPAIEALESSPGDAYRIGTLLGEALGRIHLVAAPDGLAPADAWIARGGLALAPLRARLESVPNAGRLLHLDFHPHNVLITADKVEGVIDWANTLPGPPHMDLARSAAVLRSAIAGMEMPKERLDLMRRFGDGVAEGHARVAGPDPHPALSAAWGMAMTVNDLAGHLGKPGSWVTPALLDTLRHERDTLIAAALTEAR